MLNAAGMHGSGAGRPQRKRKQTERFGARVPATLVDTAAASVAEEYNKVWFMDDLKDLDDAGRSEEDVAELGPAGGRAGAAPVDACLRSPGRNEIHTSRELLKLSAAEKNWGRIVGAARLAGLMLRQYGKKSPVNTAINQNCYWEVNAALYCGTLYCKSRQDSRDSDYDKKKDILALNKMLKAAFKERKERSIGFEGGRKRRREATATSWRST